MEDIKIFESNKKWVDKMDPLSLYIANLHIPVFHEISLCLHNVPGLIVITTLMIFIVTIKFKQKRTVLPLLLLTVLLSMIFVQGAKYIFHVERTCPVDKVECPKSYSFPSAHATLGFALLLPSIGTPAFWIYLLYSIILATSRIYLGIHSLFDIAGSFGVAIIGYTISKFIILRMRLIADEVRI